MATEVPGVSKLWTEGRRPPVPIDRRELQQVQPLQENTDESHKDSNTVQSGGADGVLESPDELTIVNDGMSVATLRSPTAQPEPRQKDGMTWLVHKYKHMLWLHTPAQLMLQGASAQLLIGQEFILIRGAHRPAFHPRPGMDDLTIVQVLENPSELDLEATFLHVAS